MTCLQCNAANLEGSSFCVHCGQPFDPKVVRPSVAPRSEEPSPVKELSAAAETAPAESLAVAASVVSPNTSLRVDSEQEIAHEDVTLADSSARSDLAKLFAPPRAPADTVVASLELPDIPNPSDHKPSAGNSAASAPRRVESPSRRPPFLVPAVAAVVVIGAAAAGWFFYQRGRSTDSTAQALPPTSEATPLVPPVPSAAPSPQEQAKPANTESTTPVLDSASPAERNNARANQLAAPPRVVAPPMRVPELPAPSTAAETRTAALPPTPTPVPVQPSPVAPPVAVQPPPVVPPVSVPPAKDAPMIAEAPSYSGPMSGTYTYAGPPVVQNGEIVVRNLPPSPLRLELTYDKDVWELRLSPGESNTRRAVLRNTKPGTQKKFVLSWRVISTGGQ